MHGLCRPAVCKPSPASSSTGSISPSRTLSSGGGPGWDGVTSKYMDCYNDLLDLVSPREGFSNFWIEVKSMEPPMIPFFGMYHLYIK
jgi:hypothetical protein